MIPASSPYFRHDPTIRLHTQGDLGCWIERMPGRGLLRGRCREGRDPLLRLCEWRDDEYRKHND
jgi:hypothetical protein